MTRIIRAKRGRRLDVNYVQKYLTFEQITQWSRCLQINHISKWTDNWLRSVSNLADEINKRGDHPKGSIPTFTGASRHIAKREGMWLFVIITKTGMRIISKISRKLNFNFLYLFNCLIIIWILQDYICMLYVYMRVYLCV